MIVGGTLKIITESAASMSLGDYSTLIAAIIAAIASIYAIYLSNKNVKQINKLNLEKQDEWNKRNIDASLKANARIEWIENVRNTTAELLSLYFDILNTSDIKKIESALVASQQKTELLVLFFGPESLQDEPIGNRSILFNKESNNGKNDTLVYFIIELAQQFSEYANAVKSAKYSKLEEAVILARNEAYRNVKQVFNGYSYTDYGDEIPQYDYEFQDEDCMNMAAAEIALTNEKEKIRKLRNDLFVLRNVIRIYLKIEWNKAKSGQ